MKQELIEQAKLVQLAGGNILISSTLFTNQSFLNIMNNLQTINTDIGSYYIINEYNPSLPIYFDHGNNIYRVKPEYVAHPVVGISWYGALFIAELLGGRLPFEKEWEYCATSGNLNYTYPWGNEHPSKEKVNYGEFYGGTTPVKMFTANHLGLYDMAGNVEEWCMDFYHPNFSYLRFSRKTDERSVKGGCWNKGEPYLKCKMSRGKWGEIGTVGIGFRIVWEV
jgi:formylglycine-generating enzyme required for sulfatase activity